MSIVVHVLPRPGSCTRAYTAGRPAASVGAAVGPEWEECAGAAVGPCARGVWGRAPRRRCLRRRGRAR
eukprot:6667231-Prymnesium_polylepis.1